MPTSEPRFPVRFDRDARDTSIARSTPAGRTAAEAARHEYENGGVPVSHLKPCEADGRDGNNLQNCVKAYIPHPNGKWGMVFMLKFDAGGRPVLMFLAFGVRHHPKGSHAPTVYDYADEQIRSSPGRS